MFDIRATGADSREVLLYDVIGFDGVSAREFADLTRDKNLRRLHLRINSIGGDVFEAVAIYNLLKSHPARVNVTIDGAALSAATIVALAGNRIEMGTGTTWMIHDPWTIAIGNATELQHQASVLDKLGDQMAGMYATRTGKPRAAMRRLMLAETWYSASEAKAAGFVDKVTDAPVPKDAAKLAADPHWRRSLAERQLAAMAR